MTTYAIRHPDRGKAHAMGLGGRSACGMFLLAPSNWETAQRRGERERVPLADVPPADLCKRCWPEGGAK